MAASSIIGSGSELPPAREVAMDDSAEERRAIFEERWRMGGLPFIGGYAIDVVVEDNFAAGHPWLVASSPITTADGVSAHSPSVSSASAARSASVTSSPGDFQVPEAPSRGSSS